MDAIRTAPQGAHYHANILYSLWNGNEEVRRELLALQVRLTKFRFQTIIPHAPRAGHPWSAWCLWGDKGVICCPDWYLFSHWAQSDCLLKNNLADDLKLREMCRDIANNVHRTNRWLTHIGFFSEPLLWTKVPRLTSSKQSALSEGFLSLLFKKFHKWTNNMQ